MELSKDLFLTDGRTPYLTISLTSRDLAAHRLLTGLSSGERDELNRLLNDQATAIARLLRASHDRQSPDRAAGSFGCGT